VVKTIFSILLAAFALPLAREARAQEVTNTNHTIVRFEISTGGTPFGSLDLELFDQEKPETVKNFLRYVYRGAYSNLVIHRLVTNFVLQAGHVTVPNPADTTAFTSYRLGTNFGRITNEYSVGPELSNDYGTIAMARIGGDTNSASDNWFINLTNNPALDAVDGGFTVFGRVVNTTGGLTGTNLLNYFNTARRGSAFINETSELLHELALSGQPLAVPRVADLFTINAKIIHSPQMPAPQHTVVRFDLFTSGTNFGNIDIELFDQEKPETVKNFLLYVWSGMYSNLVLHRLVPNFVLQAGHVRLQNPNSDEQFNTYTPSVNWGNITNEYGVGPELSNAFGTIAMARVAGQTNSANTDFFFNLTNNVTLDTNDGGFTVFGRVVNSYDAKSGTNLFTYFNSLFQFNGIGSAFTSDPFEFFTELPLSVNRLNPRLPDLFTVRATVIQGVTTRDNIPPGVVIVDPSPLPAPQVHETTDAFYTFTGIASDDQGLSRVLADDQTTFVRSVADGVTNWTLTVNLQPGTNSILVRSLDAFGNISTGEVRRIFYLVELPVTVTNAGPGLITGVTNGQTLRLGVNYPVLATPARGKYFVRWNGVATNSFNRSTYFTMSSNAVITGRFSPNIFGQTPGRYEGVFAPDEDGLRKSEGHISFSFKRNGYFVGRLRPLGANYTVRGKFNEFGNAFIAGQLGPLPLAMSMSLGGEQFEAVNGAYGDSTFIADFNLYRQQALPKTSNSPFAGRYLFHFTPPYNTNNGATDGSAFGVATVDARGRIKWTVTLPTQGKLARDGRLLDVKPLAGRAATLWQGRWSIFYSSRAGEALVGEMQCATNGFLDGGVRWFSPLFTNAQTNQNVGAKGWLYTPPASGRPFAWTNGVLTLRGGGLTNPIIAAVEQQANGTFLISSNPHNIQLFVTNATGFVGGSFIHPTSNTLTRLRGAVNQHSNTAAGFFPRQPRSGGFELRAAP
jgi:cyclophilin family peptidyl-prolyl cis-trans isomerase